jgi:heat shock protein HslJ
MTSAEVQHVAALRGYRGVDAATRVEATMARWARTVAAATILTVLLAALAGCSTGPASLDGTRWRLAEWTVSSLNPSDFTITADFAKGQISGSGGVNSYSGPYKTGPGQSFSAGPLAGTLLAGPDATTRAETIYQTLLGQAKSYKVDGGKLTLYGEGGNESLIYEEVNK